MSFCLSSKLKGFNSLPRMKNKMKCRDHWVLCILLTLQSHARPHFYSSETSFLGWMLSTAIFPPLASLNWFPTLPLISFLLARLIVCLQSSHLTTFPFPAVKDKQVYIREGFDLFLPVSTSQMSYAKQMPPSLLKEKTVEEHEEGMTKSKLH